MKRFYFLLFFLITHVCHLSAQEKLPDSAFVKLIDGNIYTGTNLIIDTTQHEIVLDQKNFNPKKIAFFKSNSGPLYGRVYTQLAKSVYSSDNMYFFRSPSKFSSSWSVYSKKGWVLYTYSIGINYMKRMTYRNAKRDLHNHPAAFRYLEKAKDNRKTALICFLIGFAGSLSAITLDNTFLWPCLGLCYGGYISCTVFLSAKKRNVYRAYKAYSAYDFDGQKWLNK